MGACSQITVFTYAVMRRTPACAPSSASAWAQMIGPSFSVPFFRLSMGTDDRQPSFSVPFFRLSVNSLWV